MFHLHFLERLFFFLYIFEPASGVPELSASTSLSEYNRSTDVTFEYDIILSEALNTPLLLSSSTSI